MYDILRDRPNGSDASFFTRMCASRAGMNIYQFNERHGQYRNGGALHDPLDLLDAFETASDPQSEPETDTLAWFHIERLREPESPSLTRAWQDKQGYMGLVLGELSRLKAERKAEEVPF